jgi:hypothetical protein
MEFAVTKDKFRLESMFFYCAKKNERWEHCEAEYKLKTESFRKAQHIVQKPTGGGRTVPVGCIYRCPECVSFEFTRYKFIIYGYIGVNVTVAFSGSQIIPL